MNAPMVPISVGAGMKNGSVAMIPYFSHQTKCPISCAIRIVISDAENGMPISSRAGCAQIHFGLNSRNELVAERKRRQAVQKVIVQLRAHNERRQDGKQQQQQMQPVRALNALREYLHFRTRYHFKGVSEWLRGIGHRG